MKRVEHMVAALGTEAFAGVMLEALNELSPVDHYAVIRFDGGQAARLALSASRPGLRIDRTVQDDYIGHYQRLDPNRALFDGLTGCAPRVARMQRNRVPDLDYRRQCYDRPGLVDRLSVIAAGASGWYCLNLFRSRESRLFSAGEEQSIHDVAALLAALTIKHDALVVPEAQAPRSERMAQTAARLRTLAPGLAPREVEVAVRILAGMASEGIALDLGIGVNSVLTYRKRIYAKLRISSQDELFSLCLFGTSACHKLM